jgi:hypothetical protein
MSIITSVIVPALVGVVLAGGVSFGLVHSQTKAPSTNPANEPILTYGQPAT